MSVLLAVALHPAHSSVPYPFGPTSPTSPHTDERALLLPLSQRAALPVELAVVCKPLTSTPALSAPPPPTPPALQMNGRFCHPFFNALLFSLSWPSSASPSNHPLHPLIPAFPPTHR